MNTFLKTYIKYVSMKAIGMTGISCYILADIYFVSRVLGANGLAALNLAIPIYSIINATGLMLGIGGATKYSIFKSQQQDKQANTTFSSIIITGLGIGLIALLIGVFFTPYIADILGADSVTHDMTSTYIRIMLCFAPFFILNNILLGFVKNDENPQLCMAGMLISSGSSIVLDYVFMVIFQLGIFGAAFSTALAPIINICILSIHFLNKKKCSLRFVFNNIKIKLALSCFVLGISSFVTELASAVELIMFNLQILKIDGNIGLAAYGILANISLICVATFTGIAQGIQPLTSQAYGRNDVITLNKIKKYSILLSLTLSFIIYSILNLFAANIINMFNSEGNQELLKIAQGGLSIYYIGIFFAGINIIIAAFLSASSQPKMGFCISICRGFIALLFFVLILPKFFGMNGIWLAYVFAEATAFLLVLFNHFNKKVKNITAI